MRKRTEGGETLPSFASVAQVNFFCLVITHTYMKHSYARLTEDDLRRIAQQDGATVMKETYEREYDQWSIEQVTACVDALVGYTTICVDEGIVDIKTIRRGALKLNEQILGFALTHRIFFEKLTTPEFVSDTRALRAVRALIAMKRRVDCGEITDTEARQHAAGVALQHAARASPRPPS
jgi:hypothetical protein